MDLGATWTLPTLPTLLQQCWLCFVGPCDPISIIYVNIQNPLCNSVAPSHSHS